MNVSDQVLGERRRLGLPSALQLPTSAAGFFNAGIDYGKQKLWYFAARMFQRAVAYEHMNAGYRRALGAAYIELGEFPAAEVELQAAAQLDPTDEITKELMQRLRRLTGT